MAKNRIDVSLDTLIKRQGKNKIKQGQKNTNQEFNAQRSFKLKRRGLNERQTAISNQNKKRRNVKNSKGKPSSIGQKQNDRKRLEWQNNSVKTGTNKRGNMNSMPKSKAKEPKAIYRPNIQTNGNTKKALVSRKQLPGFAGKSTPSKADGKTKLFTKNFDARKKIEAKRQAKEKRNSANVKSSSKVQINKSRQLQRDAIIKRKRELFMVGGNMQITSRIADEKERKALFTGSSLKVVALRTDAERSEEREALIQSDNALFITAGNREGQIEPETVSQYSLFEAKRKAQHQVERVSVLETNIPKLSSLHPMTRPKRAAPVYEPEEDHTSQAVNSSRVLITNLHPNVSQDDIFELFSAVAPLKTGRLLRSGVAEVIYETYEDAMLAYSRYHGRNLDGQPMLCKVVASELQVYVPPTSRLQQQDLKTNSKPISARPVVFTVKI